MSRHRLAVALLVVTLGTVSDAWAWGPEGHAVIADIAEAHLSPSATATVSRLLATENHRTLDEVSSWPDEIRRGKPETGPWHFVDIPLRAPAYDEGRDCHFDQSDQRVAGLTCVVAKIPEFTAILANAKESDQRRLEALKFIVHFIGDIHQPLHAEDNNHDRGGNNVKGVYNGKPSNLHAVWDGGVIEKNYGWVLGTNFSFDHAAVRKAAIDLDRAISPTDRSGWAPAGLVASIKTRAAEWANQSHELAPAAYDDQPANEHSTWPNNYQAHAWSVIQIQLEKASVRLAKILNEALS